MTPCATKYFTDSEIKLFSMVRNAVILLPDLDLGIAEMRGEPMIMSCHMLARAIASVYTLKFVDGFVIPNYEHSWVLTPEGNIIDVYPIATIGGPIMLESAEGVGPACRIYIKAEVDEYKGRFLDEKFLKSVGLIEFELRKINFDYSMRFRL